MNKTKKVRLKAFSVSYSDINGNSVTSLMSKALLKAEKVQDRRMKLNKQDEDEDIMSDYRWQNSSVLFATMLRIEPGANNGYIPSDLFDKATLNISDIPSINAAQGVEINSYKDHFYFAMNDRFLVTNMSGSFSIKRIQVYLNWLIEQYRGTNLVCLTPITRIAEGVKLKDVKSIQFNDSNMPEVNVGSGSIFSKTISTLSKDFINKISSQLPGLKEMKKHDLLSAVLFLKFKSKPKNMTEEEYLGVVGQLLQPLPTDSGATILTKDNKQIKAESFLESKYVDVDLTSTKKLNEETLKQEMETYLQTLQSNEEADL